MLRACYRLVALIAGIGMALAGSVSAQQPAPGAPPTTSIVFVPKPYKPVPIELTSGEEDQDLVAFRQRVAAVAKKRKYDELARLLVDTGFFWERDFSDSFDPSRAAVDNLALALKLESNAGSGWNWLAGLAVEAATGPMPSRPGTICSPAPPRFDEIEFDRLLEATNSDADDWFYPRIDGVPVRAAPTTSAPLADVLGVYFVRIVGGRPAEAAADFSRNEWVKVATPTAKAGFVAPGLLLSPASERLCYVRDATGRWRIGGFVGGGD
jgi:hypothetical protein